MLGFKNKKEIENPHSKRFTSDSFVVHTMQDDIDEKFLKKPSKAVKSNINSTLSPFLTKSTNDKKSIFSFKKNNTKKELASLSKKYENVEAIKTERHEIASEINLKKGLAEETKMDITLRQQDTITQNSNKKKESFFGEPIIEDNYKIDTSQKMKFGIDNLKQTTPKDIDTTTFELEQKREKLQEKNTVKPLYDPLYDVKKEYEDNLAKSNLSKLTDTSAPSFSLNLNKKQYNDKTNYSNKKSSFNFLKLFIVFFLIIIILGGVVGWFWFNGKSNMITNLLEKIGIEIEIPVKNPIVNIQNRIKNNSNDNKESSTYSLISPNYIKIQSVSSAVTDFSQSLKEITKVLEKENNSNLIPFIITTKDEKNLSFRAFATMINLTLSETIFSNLGNDFTIYAYRSPATLVTRFSIVIDSLDEMILEKELKDYETKLVDSLKPLFIETLPSRSDIGFENSRYSSHAIRFFNFKDGTNKSIDYAIIDNKLFLSTSMETMHFLIDTILK